MELFDVGIIVLGEGKYEHEARVLELMENYRGTFCSEVKYTEDLAHRMHAGSDIFLMPSRYEPCGLTQMYALRYGTPPVATCLGGLGDTIIPWPRPNATGFTFADSTPLDFYNAIKEAVTLWDTDKSAWAVLVKRAMHQGFTWERASGEYINLYSNLCNEL